jgi:hypothetical protein
VSQLADSSNVDALLSTLTILPIVLACYLETPLAETFSPSMLAEHFKTFRRWSSFFPPPDELPAADDGSDDSAPSSTRIRPHLSSPFQNPVACSDVTASQVQVTMTELVEMPDARPDAAVASDADPNAELLVADSNPQTMSAAEAAVAALLDEEEGPGAAPALAVE